MNVLFSAPHRFLSGPVLTRYDALGTRFIEVWYPDQLDDKHAEPAWVTNPGQHFVVDDGILDRFPRLRVVATPSTGTNHLDVDACRKRGVRIFSLLDDRTALDAISASAEFTFLMILNGLRRLDLGIAEVRAGRWRTREDVLRGRELQGKAVGLIGYGRIGRKVAAYCRPFGCSVAYYDPHVVGNGNSGAARVDGLSDLWSRSDVIVVCCALTDETERMIRGRTIESARRGAVIVNTSRGEVFDEDELCEVLRRRDDLVFCADVVAGEVENRHEHGPLVELFRSGRVLLTPHIAGATTESQEKAATIVLNFLERTEASS
jgi:D-3-phosphoglycerate dehydrogenase / 2-oxoglutarate reductase